MAAAASRMPRARRASPSAAWAMAAATSSESSTARRPSPCSASSAARRTRAASTSGSRRFRVNTRQRESSGAITSKEGFSVVAPTSVTVPASTWGSRASCWARFRRCSSSRKSSVRSPACRSRCARSTAARISLTPAVTAESDSKRVRGREASTRASVVLPQPGGPHRIRDGSSPACSSEPSAAPSPRRCSWPRISDSARGRMRSARGAFGFGRAPDASVLEAGNSSRASSGGMRGF
jgi:hypothetical protein